MGCAKTTVWFGKLCCVSAKTSLTLSRKLKNVTDRWQRFGTAIFQYRHFPVPLFSSTVIFRNFFASQN